MSNLIIFKAPKTDFIMKKILQIVFVILPALSSAQMPLTIEKIMQGERFTGYSPENIQWSPAGNRIYFSWNREPEPDRSLYFYETGSAGPMKATLEERKNQPPYSLVYNRERSKAVFSKEGDIFLLDIPSGLTRRITSSAAIEGSPVFSMNEDKIIFTSQNNLFSLEIATGILVQLTDFRSGKEKPDEAADRKEKEAWLYYDQLRLFTTLEERKEKRDRADKEAEEIRLSRPKIIYTGSEQAASLQLSPDGCYVTYLSYKSTEEKNTIIPGFVTESGYTEDIRSRSKVGLSAASPGTLCIYDITRDTVYRLNTGSVPGLSDKPGFVNEYPGKGQNDKEEKRSLGYAGPVWSADGKNAVIEIFSNDHKDRWIMLLDIRTGNMQPLDRQNDIAWIGGPGIRRFLGWLPDNKTVYFQSEETGYSHIYILDVTTCEKKALTSGKFEIYEPVLSKNKELWYFISNENDAGIRELYKMPVRGGNRSKITTFGGGVEFELSPDEKKFALRVSFSNKPWELYMLDNKEKAKPLRITESTTPEFNAYNWRTPQLINFRASDNVMVPARLYRPANPQKNGPAVIFVHGAGYLQNVHRWWSSYFREYMFHNFLVEKGYTVLDIDYRGSAGYGRDWRTAIYRHMGGRDLQDHIDGTKFLIEQYDVDAKRIGIYGGSYGGFITLMALFTSPGTFAAGAALRPVTDWAHYNHGYTSNILNTPVADSLSYVRSSPIYYARGLEDRLLICHGMVDDNVHFQDVIRLSQRLIELGKDNWELAAYPLESHTFTEASSWTDEYKRIFRLFEEELGSRGL
jgi:dipeptidyl aminopeptidase/acylaminoacyl peptidase